MWQAEGLFSLYENSGKGSESLKRGGGIRPEDGTTFELWSLVIGLAVTKSFVPRVVFF